MYFDNTYAFYVKVTAAFMNKLLSLFFQEIKKIQTFVSYEQDDGKGNSEDCL